MLPASTSRRRFRPLPKTGGSGGASSCMHSWRICRKSRPSGAPFSPQSRAEVPIVADLGELGRVNGRIDRLAVDGDGVLIVDFKTNRPPPRSEEAVAPLYRTQMALYRAAAQRIFPAKRIACGLVWTDGPTLMPLSDHLLDAEMRRIRARLDPHGGHS